MNSSAVSLKVERGWFIELELVTWEVVAAILSPAHFAELTSVSKSHEKCCPFGNYCLVLRPAMKPTHWETAVTKEIFQDSEAGLGLEVQLSQ